MPRVGISIGGKYFLQEEIGEGSMGSVWKAVHQTLGRPFAVKFLKAYGANADRLEQRFLQEARLAAAVQHRFVVSIVDFGLTDEGTPYMVMEYLQGESLRARLEHGPPLPVRELLRIVAQALVGLEAVHQAGVVHRDLKPENIMLVPEAGGAIPKLVDFGISRPAHEFARGNEKLTAPGMTVGTPWYMAPEQVRAADVDRRTDIYGAGVILYEAVAGRLPYEDDDMAGLLRKVAYGGAEPLMAVRPEVGPFVSAVVDRAMRVDARERFSNASEMAAALFSMMTQLPDSLVCPVRGAGDEKGTGEQGGAPEAMAFADPEISTEMPLGGAEITALVRAPARKWRPAAIAGGLLAAAVVAALAWYGSTSRQPRAVAAPARQADIRPADLQPSIERLPSFPAPASEGERVVPPDARLAGAGGPGMERAARLVPSPAAARPVRRPSEQRRSRPGKARAGSESRPEPPSSPSRAPEAFTNPGF